MRVTQTFILRLLTNDCAAPDCTKAKHLPGSQSNTGTNSNDSQVLRGTIHVVASGEERPFSDETALLLLLKKLSSLSEKNCTETSPGYLEQEDPQAIEDLR